MIFHCPYCEDCVEFGADKLGKFVICPICGESFTLPSVRRIFASESQSKNCEGSCGEGFWRVPRRVRAGLAIEHPRSGL